MVRADTDPGLGLERDSLEVALVVFDAVRLEVNLELDELRPSLEVVLDCPPD